MPDIGTARDDGIVAVYHASKTPDIGVARDDKIIVGHNAQPHRIHLENMCVCVCVCVCVFVCTRATRTVTGGAKKPPRDEVVWEHVLCIEAIINHRDGA